LEDEAAIDELPQNTEEPRSTAMRQNERRVMPFSDPIGLAESLGEWGILFIEKTRLIFKFTMNFEYAIAE
jgi:hypothetical protein